MHDCNESLVGDFSFSSARFPYSFQKLCSTNYDGEPFNQWATNASATVPEKTAAPCAPEGQKHSRSKIPKEKRAHPPAKTSPKLAKSKKRLKRSKFHRYSSTSDSIGSPGTRCFVLFLSM